MDKPCFEPVSVLRQRLLSGELRCTNLIQAFLQRIDEHDSTLNAMTTVQHEDALQQAERVDEAIRNGKRVGPLAGIPISIKDAIPTKGIRTTCNSRSRLNWIPDFEPLAVTRLREAGAIIIGKANCNEFLGIPSEDDLYPRPRNPFNPDYVSIGSSSGSGPSVAAGMCSASLGTDGAGSVRLPAAQSGLVGLKSTRGLVPGVEGEPEATLLELGPLTRTVQDCAALLDAMTSSPGADRDSSDSSGFYEGSLTSVATGSSIGVPWRYLETSPVEPEILRAFERALDELKELGVRIVDVSLPGLAEGRMATFVVLYTEHHSAHAARLKSNFGGYGESARLYAMQGAFISAADYLNALKYGRLLRANVDEALAEVDFIAMPTSPFVTAEAARKPSEHRQGMNTVFTGPFNLTGHPALTVTCGVSRLGIPIGLQLVGRYDDEVNLLRLGHRYEAATKWQELRPAKYGPEQASVSS